MGGSSKQTTVNKIPEWMEAAGKETYGKAQALVESDPNYRFYQGDRYAGTNAFHDAADANIGGQRDNAAGYMQSAGTTLNSALDNRGLMGNALDATAKGSLNYGASTANANSLLSGVADPNSLNNTARNTAGGLATQAAGRTGASEQAIGDLGALPAITGNAQARAENVQLGAGEQQRATLTNSMNTTSPFIDEAAGLTRGATQQMGMGDLTSRMNPFNQQVIRNSMDDYNRQRGRERTSITDAARSAGAFGGSRHGILEGEFDRNTSEGQQDILTKGLQDSFNQAQNQFNTDRGMQMQGGGQLGALGQQSDQRTMDFSSALGESAARDAELIRQGGQDLTGALTTSAQGRAGIEGDLAGRDLAAGSAIAGLGQDYFGQQTSLADAQKGLGESAWSQGQSEGEALSSINKQLYDQDVGTAAAFSQLAGADQDSRRQLGQDQLHLADYYQQQEQREADFDYQEFSENIRFPYEQLNYMQSMASGTPYSTSQTSSGGGQSGIGQAVGIGANLLGSFMMSDPKMKKNVKGLSNHENVAGGKTGDGALSGFGKDSPPDQREPSFEAAKARGASGNHENKAGQGVGALSSGKKRQGPVDSMSSTDDALSAFASLPISAYDYSDEARAQGAPEGRRIGFMADDWAQRFGGDGKMVDTHQAIGALAAAVQSLNNKINQRAA